MKGTCPFGCGSDYYETFDDGAGHCFGCGKSSKSSVPSGTTSVASLIHQVHSFYDSKKKTLASLKTDARDTSVLETYGREQGQSILTRKDICRWLTKTMNIHPAIAEKYGLTVYRERLILPVRSDGPFGTVVHFERRVLPGAPSTARKYECASAPRAGVIWKSWPGVCRSKRVVLVEGILDGLRVCQVMPTCAILGTAFPEEKLRALTSAIRPDTIVNIMLDLDAVAKAAKIQRLIPRSKVIVVTENLKRMTEEELREALK